MQDKKIKNIALLLLSVLPLKLSVHYFIYTNTNPTYLCTKILRAGEQCPYKYKRVTGSYDLPLSDHINTIFTNEVWLFIPVILFVLFIGWYFGLFNLKISSNWFFGLQSEPKLEPQTQRKNQNLKHSKNQSEAEEQLPESLEKETESEGSQYWQNRADYIEKYLENHQLDTIDQYPENIEEWPGIPFTSPEPESNEKPQWIPGDTDKNFSREDIQKGYYYLFILYNKLIGVEFKNVIIGRQNSYPFKAELLSDEGYWKFGFLGTAVLYNCFNDSDFESELKRLLEDNSIDEKSKITMKNYDYWQGDGFIIERPKTENINLILISNNNVINSERIVASMRDEKNITEYYYKDKISLNINDIFLLNENMLLSEFMGLELENLKNLEGPTRSNSEIAIDLITDAILPYTDEQINNGIVNIEHIYYRELRGMPFHKIEYPMIDYMQNFFSNPMDIDGNWYFTASGYIMIIKAFSKSTFKEELNNLLKANGIDKKNIITGPSNNINYSERDYWVGNGFNIEIPKIPNTYLIIISNDKFTYQE